MGRTCTLGFPGTVDPFLAELVKAMCRPRPARDDDEPGVDDDDALFEDHDAVRGLGRGFFSYDARECDSRRIDLRGPADQDPGPIEMVEAPEDVVGGHTLAFAPRRASGRRR